MWQCCYEVFSCQLGLRKHPGIASSIPQSLLYGCLFKPCRTLPRRDCHAWANLRTQNQIFRCGKLLVVCQERFCSLYLHIRADQAWPPPLQPKTHLKPRVSPAFVTASLQNAVIQIDRRDEEGLKWMPKKPFPTFELFFHSALSVSCGHNWSRGCSTRQFPVVLLSKLYNVQSSSKRVCYICSLFDCPLSTGMVDCRFSSGTVCFGESFYWSSTLELNRLCLAAHVSVVCIWREFFPCDCDSLIRKYWIHLFRSCSALVYHVKRMRAGLIAAR